MGRERRERQTLDSERERGLAFLHAHTAQKGTMEIRKAMQDEERREVVQTSHTRV
jgi:hypothetical protein